MIPVIETIPLMQLASGDRLSLQVYKFVGAQPGKKAYIQSNLHGAELAGNAVIHQFIQQLLTLKANQLQGEIWLVPVCNPLGVNARSHHFSSGRYHAYDGRDWNRIFWEYEPSGETLQAFVQQHRDADRQTIQTQFRQHIQTQFASLKSELQAPTGVRFWEKYRYLLQSLCIDADYVIDLHTSANQSLTYLYYFRDRLDSASLFHFEHCIWLDVYDGNAFDESFIKPWLALEARFAQLGRPLRFDVEAYTLELGSAMQFDQDAIAQGLRGIQNYLTQQGLLTLPSAPPPPPWQGRSVRRSQVQWYFAPAGGMVQSRQPLGQRVQAGQVLYQILQFNKSGHLPELIDIHADQSGLVFDVGLNHAVNEGEFVAAVLPDPAIASATD